MRRLYASIFLQIDDLGGGADKLGRMFRLQSLGGAQRASNKGWLVEGAARSAVAHVDANLDRVAREHAGRQ